MDCTRESVDEALKSIYSLLSQANDILEKYGGLRGNQYDYPEMQVEYCIESAFTHTLILLDRLNLARTYEQFRLIYDNAREDGFLKTKCGVDEPYLCRTAEIYGYLEAIGNTYNVQHDSSMVSKDLISILRSTLYSITDKKIFKEPPRNESEVHSRIEAVLKCIFPDLKHKPAITKPIKNFEPDTGLPSIRTLIEYKFISTQGDAKRISDEVLADTRGYISREWSNFIYLIYETSRIKPESEWKNLLEECEIRGNTKIIVLSGESVDISSGSS
jgi:hypothetical protein